MPTKLKPKEQLFCFYFARLRNSKEAAIKAGFPPLIAEHSGDNLLQRKSIVDCVKELSRQSEYDELLQATISGLSRLAFSPINDTVKLALLSKEQLETTIDELDLFHISEIKIPKDNTIEVKFFDRFKAFDKLIELVQASTGKQDANEFYKALEAGATLLNRDGNADGI